MSTVQKKVRGNKNNFFYTDDNETITKIKTFLNGKKKKNILTFSSMNKKETKMIERDECTEMNLGIIREQISAWNGGNAHISTVISLHTLAAHRIKRNVSAWE